MSFKADIIDILGDGLTLSETIFGNALPLVEQAVWDVGSTLPTTVLIKSAVTIAANDDANIELDKDTVVLYVERFDETLDATFACQEIGIEDRHTAFSDKSIHQATGYTPVYYIEPDSSNIGGVIKTAPASTGNNTVTALLYQRQAAGAAATEFDWTLDADDTGVATPSFLPQECFEAIKYLIASRLLTQHISFLVLDEEDTELASLAKEAQNSIQEELKMQMAKLKKEEAKS